jgi:hypothetical protein
LPKQTPLDYFSQVFPSVEKAGAIRAIVPMAGGSRCGLKKTPANFKKKPERQNYLV